MVEWQIVQTKIELLLKVNIGNKLEGDMGNIVSLQAESSPFFQLREKFKCIEHMDRSVTQLKTSP